MSILGKIRQKYTSFIPKERDILDPETGEVLSSLDETGAEVLDPTPMSPPIGYFKQPSMAEYIRELILAERTAQEARDAGFETLEESEDFDIPDDPIDPRTPYENDYDPSLQEIEQAIYQEQKEKAAADQAATGTELAQPASSAEPKPEMQPSGVAKVGTP